MPTKPLTPEQKADAKRLRDTFRAWQAGRRAQKLPATQEEVAPLLGFGQSALSQYLNATIPLNAEALLKFTTLLGVSAAAISPQIVKQERERALAWLDADKPAEKPGKVADMITGSQTKNRGDDLGRIGRGVRGGTPPTTVTKQRRKG